MPYLLHHTFTETVKKTPDKIAITEEEGKEISYDALNKLSNQFANFFLNYKHNTKQCPFVGILSSIHIHSIAAVLGTLKIGCAYIPLDEHSPTQRLQPILDNTKLDILVVDPNLYEKYKPLFDHAALKVVLLLSASGINQTPDKIMHFEAILDSPNTEPPLLNQVSDNLAYILHTSGSTGTPKGIMLTHRNARTFVDWMHKEFQLTDKDVIMSRAPLKFDLSVFDLFNCFKSGARLVCYNWNRKREGHQKHQDYVRLMAREQATVLYTTPSTLIALMNHGGLTETTLKLTRLMYAGEPFPIPQLRQLRSVLTKTSIANIYGPTETNIITYYWIKDIPEGATSIPLGQVVDDTEILVVNERDHSICSTDEVGELWCRGGTVTLGYLGMPEKTTTCLVQSPFHRYPCVFWRTGDYGYYDLQGVLHYKGRRDHIIKIKGYRVELGEIEAALAQFPGLDEFAIVANPHLSHGYELTGFVSFLDGVDLLKIQLTPLLKKFLTEKLPAYMVPNRFVKLNHLPKTSTGKIDRVSLAALAHSGK